jgi:hypothetical protein
MEQLQTLAIALGLSSLVGLRLYLTVFLTSLALNQGWLKLHSSFESLGILGSDAVLIASGVLLVLEFMADKVQGFDSVWDSIHTFIRPIGATILALQVLGDWPAEAKVIAALCAGAVALTVHSAKAGTRLIVNTSPEPVSNIAVSTVEDLAVAGMFTLLIANPLLGGSILLVGVAFCAWFTPKAFRMSKATGWLLWQRLTRATSVPAHTPLPHQLSPDHDVLVSNALGHDATVDWAVDTLSSRTKGFRGLTNNRFGLLVATSTQPDTLVFLARKLFRRSVVRLPLAGCHFVRQSTFLSENLVIYQRESRRRAVFRFAKAEEAIVNRLVDDLRARTGAPTPGRPTPSTFPDRLTSPALTSGVN